MIETINLNTLGNAQVEMGAAKQPVEIAPGCDAADPAFLHVIGSEAMKRELAAVNQSSPAPNALSCTFIRDVRLQGSGYLFHGEAMVADGSHLSNVALEWVQKPMPDSPLHNRHFVDRWVTGLAIVIVAPGHRIYGHWLIDLLPRAMIAKAALGDAFARACIPLPDDTPDWAISMLHHFAGVLPEQIVPFNRDHERILMRDACVPSYIHHDYAMHPFSRQIFAAPRPVQPSAPSRRLCLSRAAFENGTAGQLKKLLNRDEFEARALSQGYEVVQPEKLPLDEQIAMFRSASHVIGEFGSALHSSVFARDGMRIGYIRCPNSIQLRISALWQQPSVIVVPREESVGANGAAEYWFDRHDMEEFFTAMHTNQ